MTLAPAANRNSNAKGPSWILSLLDFSSVSKTYRSDRQRSPLAPVTTNGNSFVHSIGVAANDVVLAPIKWVQWKQYHHGQTGISWSSYDRAMGWSKHPAQWHHWQTFVCHSQPYNMYSINPSLPNEFHHTQDTNWNEDVCSSVYVLGLMTCLPFERTRVAHLSVIVVNQHEELQPNGKLVRPTIGTWLLHGLVP